MPQIPITSQIYIGRGLNLTTSKVHAVAIEYDSPQVVNTGQKISLSMESLVSSTELIQKLDIQASASFTGSWGVNAEFSLAQQRDFNKYYTYAIIRVVVQNPPLLIRNPRFKPEAWDLLKQKGWEAFSAIYGWDYCEGIISGGSYSALIEMATTSEKQQQDVKAKLSGFYGGFKASAELKAAFSEIQKTVSTNVYIYQSGGSGDVLETTLEQMIDQAAKFPQLISSSPDTVYALVADYVSTVPPPSGENIPAQDSLARQRQRDSLKDLANAYLRLRDYKANLRFILDHLPEFDEFRALDSAALSKKKDEYQASLNECAKEIDAIVKNASRCSDNFDQCQTYVQSFRELPLPTIGGQLMNIKQIEEKLASLEQDLALLRSGQRAFDNITINNGTINSPGRMHIHGGEYLYALNKNGMVVSKAWGGNGNLAVEGNVNIGDDLTLQKNMFVGGGVISTSGNLHTWGENLLYLLNKDGTIVSKAWGGNGNLKVEGHLQVDGVIATGGRDLNSRGLGGGIYTWDVIAEGAVYSVNGFHAIGADVAENFLSDTELEAGDVVSLNRDNDTITRSATPNDPLVFGIVSSKPGLVLNSKSKIQDEDSEENLFPIAFTGRVPCKVSAENGSIQRGDMLTSSSIPGHAMKAKPITVDNQEVFKAGTIIGKALESFKSGTGIIDILVYAK